MDFVSCHHSGAYKFKVALLDLKKKMHTADTEVPANLECRFENSRTLNFILSKMYPFKDEHMNGSLIVLYIPGPAEMFTINLRLCDRYENCQSSLV